ncbi:hypothetical protein [Streptomyces marianii]|uniref:LPXTG cell wall anchor domain-containing protein n=1 Tax=Streptomyces marianii TaxID=1817406 RepID=A0A5R9DQW4_9ACTN|nr:hypothetical protein [Streptomyces marianii]TLQ38848.1 hypothetical protein FEF34_40260 [Streptomyces marianii]
MSPDERETFDQVIAGFNTEAVEIIDPTPYGGAPAGKTGLTPRGKVVMGLAGAAILGATLVGYTAYSADSDQADARAQEITLQRERLELERMKEINKANADDRKAATEASTARQAALSDCIKDGSAQIGKTGGPWSRTQVVDECQKLGDGDDWSDTKTGTDMANAASTSDLNTNDDGGDSGNNGLLWLVGGGAALAVIGAKKAKKA